MVTILKFRCPDRRVPADETSEGAMQGERRSAEIIIFPGVRIERRGQPRSTPDDAPEALRHAVVPAQAD